MYIEFQIKEQIELFTTFDYNNVLSAIVEHIVECCNKVNIDIPNIRPYFNPKLNKGVVHYDSLELIYIEDMHYGIGNDVITVVFP
jgi:hypothetical protein